MKPPLHQRIVLAWVVLRHGWSEQQPTLTFDTSKVTPEQIEKVVADLETGPAGKAVMVDAPRIVPEFERLAMEIVELALKWDADSALQRRVQGEVGKDDACAAFDELAALRAPYLTKDWPGNLCIYRAMYQKLDEAKALLVARKAPK